MKVRCINTYKKMIAGEIYEYKIARSGKSINVIIDKDTQYSFHRYQRCHFKGDNEDVNYVEYIKEVK